MVVNKSHVTGRYSSTDRETLHDIQDNLELFLKPFRITKLS